MTEERQVIEFVRRFHQTCLEQQDVEQIGQMLSDDIEWTGAGIYNRIKGRENVLNAYAANQNSDLHEYQILNADYTASALAGHIYSFSGSCYVRCRRKQQEDGERVVRVSGICRFEDGAGYMMRLHHSLPNRAWESDLQHMTQEEVWALRSLVGLQSKELEEKNSNLDALIQNIPGGVICCRDDADLELIFYSDGF
ncbi:MAG: nuclear transport factor 2 family protein [Clostridiaceae bacterium]|nr:nuclear transport factor 2 family protein [Clostridiaceae bacterium]